MCSSCPVIKRKISKNKEEEFSERRNLHQLKKIFQLVCDLHLPPTTDDIYKPSIFLKPRIFYAHIDKTQQETDPWPQDMSKHLGKQDWWKDVCFVHSCNEMKLIEWKCCEQEWPCEGSLQKRVIVFPKTHNQWFSLLPKPSVTVMIIFEAFVRKVTFNYLGALSFFQIKSSFWTILKVVQ